MKEIVPGEYAALAWEQVETGAAEARVPQAVRKQGRCSEVQRGLDGDPAFSPILTAFSPPNTHRLSTFFWIVLGDKSERGHTVYGRGFSVACFRAMELLTILNRCHRFSGFVYQRARFSPDHKSIEVAVRPRKGSAAICSRCHQPAPGYDQLAERRFQFIPLWGFLVFLLYTMRRVDSRRCGAIVVEEVP